MAKYWEMRETIFGDKAFLPMTLEGALSDDFQTMLTCPNFCRLVFDAEDRGRTILFGNTEGVDLNNLPRGTMVSFQWIFIEAFCCSILDPVRFLGDPNHILFKSLSVLFPLIFLTHTAPPPPSPASHFMVQRSFSHETSGRTTRNARTRTPSR